MFKPLKKKLAIIVLIGFSLILIGIWLIHLQIIFDVSNKPFLICLRLFILLSAIVSLSYGSSLVACMFTTVLKVSEAGILYKQLFSSIFCSWDEIVGFRFSDSQFFLKCNGNIKVKGSFLGKIFRLVNHEIPIHLFVDSEFQIYDWNNNEILQLIKKYTPRVFREISLVNGWEKE